MIPIASVLKFEHKDVFQILRHDQREILNSSNPEIDPNLSSNNKTLSPIRYVSPYNFYKQRLSELYVYGRKDIKTMLSVVVTLPRDYRGDEMQFFEKVYELLSTRFGGHEKCNEILCTLHVDESQKHLAYKFIPAVYDSKRERWKCCANEVWDKAEYQNFHPMLQKWLYDSGINAKVATGITAAQGGNRTVRDMKLDRDLQREREKTHNNDRSRF